MNRNENMCIKSLAIMVALVVWVSGQRAPAAALFEDDFNYVGVPDPAKWDGPWGDTASVNGDYGTFGNTTYSQKGGFINPVESRTTFDFRRPSPASGNVTVRLYDAWPWSGLGVLEITPTNIQIDALQNGISTIIAQIPMSLDTWYSVSVRGYADHITKIAIYERSSGALVDNVTFWHDACGPWNFHLAAAGIADLDNVNISTDPASCAEAIEKGYVNPADLNKNCYVDLSDFARLGQQWLGCTNPLDETCVSYEALAAGLEVTVQGGHVTFVNPRTGRLVATLLAPEAGYAASGNSLTLLEISQDNETVYTRWGGNSDFEIYLTFHQIVQPPCVRIRLAGQWVGQNQTHDGTGVEVWTTIPLQLAEGSFQQGQAFLRQGWSCDWSVFSTPLPGWVGAWGCPAFHFESGSQEMSMPFAAFSTESDDLITLIEPRSAFNVSVNYDRLCFSRKLFILPEAGMTDESIDLHDGLLSAYHELYVGAEKEPSWNTLYGDYLLRIFPQLAQSPAVELPNVMTAGVSKFAFTQRWAKRLYSFGIRILSIGSKVHLTEDYLDQTGQLYAHEASQLGMATMVGLDRYACDPEKELGYGIPLGSQLEELIWYNVMDSLWLTAGGDPIDCWSGMWTNMSPEFSYSDRLLAELDSRLDTYNYDVAFVDYYLDGGGFEETHSYGQYPFYPQIVSDNWFLKELSELVHTKGKYLQINAPSSQLTSTNQFYDIVSGDIPLTMGFYQKLQSVNKPCVYYGNSHVDGYWFTTEGWLRDAFRGLLYGSAVSPWAWQPEGPDSLTNNVFYLLDVERGRPLFARNSYLMSRLAGAALCDGNLIGMTWTAFRHPQGSRYLVTANMTDSPLCRYVPLAGTKLELDQAHYALIEWDLEQGGLLLAKNVTSETLATFWSVELEPYEIKLLCIEPVAEQEDVIHLDYFAHVGDPCVWLRSATDQVLMAQIEGSPEYASFTIKGHPEVQFESQFGYLATSKPNFISVVGASEYAVNMQEGIIRVWGMQDANSTTIQFDGGLGVPLALIEGQMLRVTDAFTEAEVAYDIEQGSIDDWTFNGGTWDFLPEGALHQSDILTTWSSATLNMPWSGNYELSYRTTMQRDLNSSQFPELKLLIGKMPGLSQFSDDFNYVGVPDPAKWAGPWGDVASVNGDYGSFGNTTYSQQGGFINPVENITTFDIRRPSPASGNVTVRLYDAWPWSGIGVLEFTPTNIQVDTLQGGVSTIVAQIPISTDTWYSVSVQGYADNTTDVAIYDRSSGALVGDVSYWHDPSGPWNFHFAAAGTADLDNVIVQATLAEGVDVSIATHNYSFPNLFVGAELIQHGLDLALYPNRYQPYTRFYDWRIRQQAGLITLSISYDGGMTFETFMDWQSGSAFQPAFAILCRNATLLLDRVILKLEDE